MYLLADVVTALEEHQLAPLWMPVYWFAIIPAAIFTVMGFVTFSFRDVANRHRRRTTPVSDKADQHDIGGKACKGCLNGYARII